MTVQEVFDIAINLIDAQNENTGSTHTADTREYELRTPSLLNSLLDRVYPYSDTFYAPGKGVRAVCEKVHSLEDMIDLDDYICSAVLPYGLAALLVKEENPDTAAFCWQMFEEGKEDARKHMPASTFDSVEDVYGYGCHGGVEHGEFGSWL